MNHIEYDAEIKELMRLTGHLYNMRPHGSLDHWPHERSLLFLEELERRTKRIRRTAQRAVKQ